MPIDMPGKELAIKTFAPPTDGRADEGVRRGEAPLQTLYPSEITCITMLGDGKPLPWKLNNQGLVIAMPEKKPCEHAFVVKIERKKPF